MISRSKVPWQRAHNLGQRNSTAACAPEFTKPNKRVAVKQTSAFGFPTPILTCSPRPHERYLPKILWNSLVENRAHYLKHLL